MLLGVQGTHTTSPEMSRKQSHNAYKQIQSARLRTNPLQTLDPKSLNLTLAQTLNRTSQGPTVEARKLEDLYPETPLNQRKKAEPAHVATFCLLNNSPQSFPHLLVQEGSPRAEACVGCAFPLCRLRPTSALQLPVYTPSIKAS